MWPFFSILAICYAALFLFKSKYHVLSEQIYERYGLDIGLFQFKLSLPAKRRWVTNIPTMKKCKIFYKYGTIISLILIIPSLIFLIWNLYKIFNIAWPSTSSNSNQPGKDSDTKLDVSEELIFQPVIPGVTFPLSDIGVYGFSLFLSTVFHELGHALAADCQDVKLLGYGLLIIFIIPAAYVDLSTAELKSLSLTDQLKVYTAGIWHNLVLSLVALLLLYTIPTVIKPFYNYKTGGVAILQLKSNSSVNGPSGLKVGQILTAVNDCKVDKISDFYSCIKTEGQLSEKGFCLPKTLIDEINCSDSQECCGDKNNGTFLSFQGRNSYCLPVRLATNSSVEFCSLSKETANVPTSNQTIKQTCFDENHECVKPVLPYLHEKLWLIKRDQGQKDFLFIGFSTDLMSGIEMLTNFVPKYSILPVGLPVLIEKGLYYTCSFSLALALINIVPCIMLDGQFIIKALMQMCCSPTKAFCISSTFIYLGSGLLLTNLLMTFMLL